MPYIMQTSIANKATNHECYLPMIYSCIIHLPAPTKHKSLINKKRTVFSFHKSASEAILDGIKKHCDVQRKRMRIAALQYANGQVKHCDDLIEPSQCFLRVFKYVFRIYKYYHQTSLQRLSSPYSLVGELYHILIFKISRRSDKITFHKIDKRRITLNLHPVSTL